MEKTLNIFKRIVKKVFRVKTRFFEIGKIVDRDKYTETIKTLNALQRDLRYKELEHLLEQFLSKKYENRILVKDLKGRVRKFIVIKCSEVVNVIIPIEVLNEESTKGLPLLAIKLWKYPALPVRKLFRLSFGSNLFFLESSLESLKDGLRKNLNWKFWMLYFINKSLRDDEMFRVVFVKEDHGDRFDIYFLAEVPTKHFLKKQTRENPKSVEIIDLSPN
ncbi:MAG: hypothetical protein PHT54_05120 [Candidatus Nanoarchaeia archaeon]|nr:hypothetical protein [Candidatus Nanoarchaeia archaeon]